MWKNSQIRAKHLWPRRPALCLEADRLQPVVEKIRRPLKHPHLKQNRFGWHSLAYVREGRRAQARTWGWLLERSYMNRLSAAERTFRTCLKKNQSIFHYTTISLVHKLTCSAGLNISSSFIRSTPFLESIIFSISLPAAASYSTKKGILETCRKLRMQNTLKNNGSNINGCLALVKVYTTTTLLISGSQVYCRCTHEIAKAPKNIFKNSTYFFGCAKFVKNV